MEGVRRWSSVALLAGAALALVTGAHELAAQGEDHNGKPTRAEVLRGREIVITRGCGGCHSATLDMAQPGWLAGKTIPLQEFLIGPCALDSKAQPCFHTRPRNLTPDNVTGIGRFSRRQIFNALRFGLRPGETPDVEITSTTPGKGNFPVTPRYLAPPMPWPEWRHMTDQQLWDITAYLKYGLKPFTNQVEDSEGPPDFWASAYTPKDIGMYPAQKYPTATEKLP